MNIHAKPSLAGRATCYHYRRGQLINEFGNSNTIQDDWIRWGLMAFVDGAVTLDNKDSYLPQNSTTAADGDEVVPRSPQFIEVGYTDANNQLATTAKGAVSAGGNPTSQFISAGNSPTGSVVGPQTGGGVVVTSEGGPNNGYFKNINQGVSNLNLSFIKIWHGGSLSGAVPTQTYVQGTGTGSGVLLAEIAPVGGIANSTRIITGDDVFIKYENVIQRMGSGTTNAYAGLSQAAAYMFCQKLCSTSLNANIMPITKAGLWNLGDSENGFSDPIEFDLDVGLGNQSTGQRAGSLWANADFEAVVATTTGNADTQVGTQRSRTTYTNSVNPHGAWVSDANDTIICNFPSAYIDPASNLGSGNSHACGYITSNSGKRHSILFTIEVSNGNFGYSW